MEKQTAVEKQKSHTRSSRADTNIPHTEANTRHTHLLCPCGFSSQNAGSPDLSVSLSAWWLSGIHQRVQLVATHKCTRSPKWFTKYYMYNFQTLSRISFRSHMGNILVSIHQSYECIAAVWFKRNKVHFFNGAFVILELDKLRWKNVNQLLSKLWQNYFSDIIYIVIWSCGDSKFKYLPGPELNRLPDIPL